MLISCAVTEQPICDFVFAYAKIRFSHDMAHFTLSKDRYSHDNAYLILCCYFSLTIEIYFVLRFSRKVIDL